MTTNAIDEIPDPTLFAVRMFELTGALALIFAVVAPWTGPTKGSVVAAVGLSAAGGVAALSAFLVARGIERRSRIAHGIATALVGASTVAAVVDLAKGYGEIKDVLTGILLYSLLHRETRAYVAAELPPGFRRRGLLARLDDRVLGTPVSTRRRLRGR